MTTAVAREENVSSESISPQNVDVLLCEGSKNLILDHWLGLSESAPTVTHLRGVTATTAQRDPESSVLLADLCRGGLL